MKGHGILNWKIIIIIIYKTICSKPCIGDFCNSQIYYDFDYNFLLIILNAKRDFMFYLKIAELRKQMNEWVFIQYTNVCLI